MSDTATHVIFIAALKFPLGQLVTTPNALETLTQEDIQTALNRHCAADWGTLDSHDWNQNERALAHGGRLFSAYVSESGEKFWIITEADRSSTCVLMPEDY